MKPTRLIICPVYVVASLWCLNTVAQDKPAVSENVFQSQVRTTEPLSAEDELSALNVPDGFEVQLFASEPQIQKPLNMAFDAKGRLWATGSNQYPFPAKEDAGTDTIHILEDTTGDGKADKVTTFADNLNIPIGLYPYQDGVIVFSIPNILFLRDTNGDGKADERKVLYGPFDTTRDTHGMNNAFRRGFDGWLYCCHGFNNQSQVSGADGHTVTMHSGNTYRIRLDGSRIEHFTHGQVNPFGMTIDANGDIFNSDCHTKPVSMLIRDGFYESFGKPHDGLGFVPNVMTHLHGSTAIDALCQYQGNVFPDEYRDDLFVGNVMTCRVHRNSIVRNGSSVQMKKEDDFLISDDPWFRPVDIQVGPDGALYIADFYNRIIGHYEVPLDHPGRDRKSGRIWRVSWKGSESEGDSDGELTSDTPAPADLTTASVAELIAVLGDDRKGIRQHAADQIVDRVGSAATLELLNALKSELDHPTQAAAPQLLWTLQRLDSLTSDYVADTFSNGNERTRIHVMRICSERKDTSQVQGLIRTGLRDTSPLVQRAASDAAARHPAIQLAKEVINATVVSPASDRHLKHALKIALRNQFRSPNVVKWFTQTPPPPVAADAVRAILPGLSGDAVGRLTVFLLKNSQVPTTDMAQMVKHGARFATDDELESLTEIIAALPAGKITEQTEIWTAMSDALRLRKKEPPRTFVRWSRNLATQVFQEVDFQEIAWGHYSLNGDPFVTWGFEPRFPEPGADRKVPFISSLPGGERGVGVLRSRPFVLPLTLEVRICGHLGPPDKSAIPQNRLILRAAGTGEEIYSALPPRNDTATTITWKPGAYAGSRAILEIVDGINRSAYAWIGVGKLNPPVLKTENFDGGAAAQQLAAAVKIIRNQQLDSPRLKPETLERMKKIVASVQLGGAVRTLAAQSLLLHYDQSAVVAVSDLLQIATTPTSVEKNIVAYCFGPQNESQKFTQETQQTLINNTFSQVDQNIRKRLVTALSETAAGAGLLVAALDNGTPSAEVLRDERLVGQLSGFGPEIAERVQKMRNTLLPEQQKTQQLAENVLRRYRLGEGDIAAGEGVFRKHCINCHRRGNEGGIAGPQLNGIATRGASRLLEDLLQPNLNVDVNFRTSTLVLNDGRVVSGIVRTTPPPSVLLKVFGVDGKVKDVSGDDVEERKVSQLSLMPANVATTMTEDDLLNLVKWLMN